eukprot:TRINITY_DN23149_c1_g1_i5.p1 TRINITY_DN23149_c1_g1~~TRINITY_DN23149_c1_g1_i5.p1  ORF type:complete len:317 (+),score=-17.37 TRINITY_DN23149_c1_g1_i5:125-952(+)
MPTTTTSTHPILHTNLFQQLSDCAQCSNSVLMQHLLNSIKLLIQRENQQIKSRYLQNNYLQKGTNISSTTDKYMNIQVKIQINFQVILKCHIVFKCFRQFSYIWAFCYKIVKIKTQKTLPYISKEQSVKNQIQNKSMRNYKERTQFKLCDYKSFLYQINSKYFVGGERQVPQPPNKGGQDIPSPTPVFRILTPTQTTSSTDTRQTKSYKVIKCEFPPPFLISILSFFTKNSSGCQTYTNCHRSQDQQFQDQQQVFLLADQSNKIKTNNFLKILLS